MNKTFWRKMFGTDVRPSLNLTSAQISLKAQSLAGKMSISGVQPKLSLRLRRASATLEVSAEKGEYILKPQIQTFPDIPQNENLCMDIATALGIDVPLHCLLRLKDGTYAYVVRRFDRKGKRKIPQEDFAQVLGKRDKYDSSVEEIGKKLKAVSDVPGLDVQLFFERVVLNYLLGNGDAHLKNYSINYDADGRIRLSPAYDIVASRLVIPGEDESALTINGKRNNLKRSDFDALAGYLNIPAKVRYQKFTGREKLIVSLAEKSELPAPAQKAFRAIIGERYRELGVDAR